MYFDVIIEEESFWHSNSSQQRMVIALTQAESIFRDGIRQKRKYFITNASVFLNTTNIQQSNLWLFCNEDIRFLASQMRSARGWRGFLVRCLLLFLSWDIAQPSMLIDKPISTGIIMSLLRLEFLSQFLNNICFTD
jgi:hypothetical protein